MVQLLGAPAGREVGARAHRGRPSAAFERVWLSARAVKCIIFNFEVNISHPTKSRIPPLHALQALEAFARLGTVWEAAEDLGITRSAVSHRLAMLESSLGFELAARSGKGVALTPRGKR